MCDLVEAAQVCRVNRLVKAAERADDLLERLLTDPAVRKLHDELRSALDALTTESKAL